MGTYDPSGPPDGGKVVFEVLRVSDWLDGHFEDFAGMAIKTFFVDALRDRLDKTEAERWLRHYRVVTRSDVFRESIPGRLSMTWAPEANRKKLYLGVYNRLCLLRVNELWERVSAKGRIEHAFRVAWLTHLRCATVRALLYAGVAPPVEKPFLALDDAKKPHLVDIGIVPVTSFGRRDL